MIGYDFSLVSALPLVAALPPAFVVLGFEAGQAAGKWTRAQLANLPCYVGELVIILLSLLVLPFTPLIGFLRGIGLMPSLVLALLLWNACGGLLIPSVGSLLWLMMNVLLFVVAVLALVEIV